MVDDIWCGVLVYEVLPGTNFVLRVSFESGTGMSYKFPNLNHLTKTHPEKST